MKRRSFAEVLKSAKIDINLEYQRLYVMFYKEKLIFVSDFLGGGTYYTLEDFINKNFYNMSLKGNSLSLTDFDYEYGFTYKSTEKNSDEDYLISFCEYCINLTFDLKNVTNGYTDRAFKIIRQQVNNIIEKLGYMRNMDGRIVTYVPKSPSSISVSEILPKAESYKVIHYNHHSMKGDVDGKKEILRQLGALLEPKEKELAQINSSLKSDIFFALNNLNIRHNNFDPLDKSNYKKCVAEMKTAELENLYDELYQMILLAFLELDNKARKVVFEDLKKSINQTK